ncbi:MAG TPA: hypothetical protein VFU32_04840 [Ktedonobacterales bacterium]|nr:hypothetical protein [Ktedonobacterales bacterium]
MVKADWRPFTRALKTIVPMTLFLALGNWVLRGEPFLTVPFAGASFVISSLFWGSIRESRRLWRAEKRRRATASGAQNYPLASPQPYPAPEALPLPFVISIKPGRLAFLLTPVITWIAVVCALYIGFWSYVWPNEGPVIHTLALTLALMLAISAGFLFSMYRWIEVDEDGLTVRNIFWSKRILWHEARLFAVDAALKEKEDLDSYELSSTTAILRWPWKRKASRFTKLSCSFVEYEWQMKALHSVIAARTGLPLYDLRDGVASGPQAVPFPQPQSSGSPFPANISGQQGPPGAVY